MAGTPQVRPCRLGSRIHAADTPQSDTAPPLTVSRCLVDPRHAWMLFDQLSRYSISIEIHPRMAWIYVSTKVDTHQGQAMPFQQIAEICRRRGGSGCGGVSAMGPRHASGGLGRTPNPGLAVCAGLRTRARRDRAYMDVLAASPATGPTPPSHGMPAFASAVAVAVAVAAQVAGQRPALPLRRVQGAALPTHPPTLYLPP
ncbi:hypothetical protein J2X70_004070 [Stenotrophomonas sp. 1337]|nr:hypothetical protein [Stenotrophomonas sp. 1337]